MAADRMPALDVLGDANRRAIVELLAHGPASVQELADQMPISRPAVSRHPRLLKDADLVVDEPQGARHVYRLRADGIAALQEYFARLWSDVAHRYRLVAENTDTRSPDA